MSGQRHGVFSGPGARARATRHDDDERKEQCPLTREDAAAGAAALAEHIQIVDEAFFAAESAVLAAFTHVSALASLAAAVAAAVGDLGLLALDANGEEHETELVEGGPGLFEGAQEPSTISVSNQIAMTKKNLPSDQRFIGLSVLRRLASADGPVGEEGGYRLQGAGANLTSGAACRELCPRSATPATPINFKKVQKRYHRVMQPAAQRGCRRPVESRRGAAQGLRTQTPLRT